MAHLGIDLGTSNTLVARVTAAGQPVLEEIDNERMVPSVVYLERESDVPVVGRAALDMWADSAYEPARCFRRWKPWMATGAVLARLETGGGRPPLEVTPETLTTLLLEYVVRQLEGLGGEAVESVLVTVPHGWRRGALEKVRSTRRAAESARLRHRPLPVQPRTVSEPVAAAAYWLWTARGSDAATTFAERVLLVCDIGGGTIDLALVRVGGADDRLEVIDAAHGEGAGDYADALLCTWAARQFPAGERQGAPDNPEDLFRALAAGHPPWLRRWFVRAQQLKHDLSLRAERARGPVESIKPVRTEFATDRALRTLGLGVAELETELEPFYRGGRELLKDFLAKSGEVPYAVAFAGGGSRIHGVRHRMVEPALADLYGPNAATEILERIRAADGRLDQAIALGAALIANGTVTVTERLPDDVGLVGTVPPPLASALDHGDAPILISPMIARGTPLPASADTRDMGIVTTTGPEGTLRVQVVVDDDPAWPWVQEWELELPTAAQRRSVSLRLHVDLDGELRVQVETSDGGRAEASGSVHRPSVPPSGTRPSGSTSAWLRTTPDRFRDALESITPPPHE